MDVLFLDANVLFSAAYREGAGLLALWKKTNVSLITSAYAVAEAQRNLKNKDQHLRLDELVNKMTIIHESNYLYHSLPSDLAEKDKPILAAAIIAKADYLITGDFKDFGKYFGKKIKGIMVLPPADYLNSRLAQK